MAATLKNLTSYAFGLTAETGINVESCRQTFQHNRLDVPDQDGDFIGFVSHGARMTGTVSGEVAGNTGIMACELATNFTLANLISAHGVSNGLVFCDQVDRELNRQQLARITVAFFRFPGITA